MIKWFNKIIKSKRSKDKISTENKYIRTRPSILESIYSQSPEAIIIIDTNSIIVDWSEKAEELYGWKHYEVLGELLTDIIIPEEYREKHLTGMKKYLETKQSRLINSKIPVALPSLHRNGHIIPIHLFLTESTSETGKILFIGFIKDVTEITENLNTIKSIEESSNTFNLFLMSIPSPIAVFIEDGSCIFRNKAFQQLNNCNCTNLNCKCTSNITNIEFLKNNIVNVGKYGISMKFKTQCIHEINRYYDIDIIRTVYDNKCLILLYLIDVTEKLTNKDDSTYHHFRERNSSLNSKMKSDFLEELGPKIYIQVSSIENYLNTITIINEDDTTITKSTISNIENNKSLRKHTNTLFNIVNSIKNISKLDSDLVINKVDLNNIIDNIYAFYKKKTSKKGITLDLQVSLNIKDTYNIPHGDKIQIIFKELLDNAVKFTFKGNISLEITDYDTYINIYVRDTGTGIEKNFIGKLFKPFSKQTETEADSSLGLGLYIVQSIAILLKGSVTVDSKVGRGTNVCVNIPY